MNQTNTWPLAHTWQTGPMATFNHSYSSAHHEPLLTEDEQPQHHGLCLPLTHNGRFPYTSPHKKRFLITYWCRWSRPWVSIRSISVWSSPSTFWSESSPPGGPTDVYHLRYCQSLGDGFCEGRMAILYIFVRGSGLCDLSPAGCHVAPQPDH